MSDNTPVDLTKEVDFDYPEGLQEAARALDFLPEGQAQVELLTTFINNLTLL